MFIFIARSVVLVVALLCLKAQAAPILFLSPAVQTAPWQSPVTVDLMISGLKSEDPAQVLGGFDVSLTFDPAYLSLASVDFGPFLGGPGETFDLVEEDLSSPAASIVRLFSVSLLEVSDSACIFCTGPYLANLQGDSFALARLTFDWRAPAPGVTTIDFASATLADGFGAIIPIAALIPAQVQIPEPAAPALLGLGLFLLAWARRGGRASPQRAPTHTPTRCWKAALAALAFGATGPALAQVTASSPFVLAATEQGTLDAYFTTDGIHYTAPLKVADQAETRYGDMAVADFNGDGLLDFLALDNETTALHLYLRTGPTSFQPFGIGALATDPKRDYYNARNQRALAPDYGLGIIPADLDNDGDMDFLDARNKEFGPGLFWIATGDAWINDGTGHFTQVPHAFDFADPAGSLPGSIFTGWTLGTSITLGDVDGDHIPDMLASEQSSGGDQPSRVYLLRGLGDGRFGPPEYVFTAPHPATFISLGDVNNTGTVDALVGMDDDGDPGQVYVFFGKGDGTFFQTPYEAFDTNPTESGSDQPGGGKFQLVDITGDGVLDAVASPALTGPVTDVVTPGRLVVYRGLGDGRFVLAGEIDPQIFVNTGFAAPTGGRPILVHQPGDFDNTGGIDYRDVQFLLGPSRPAMSPEDPFDLNRDGVVNVGDARRLVLMCTLPRCALVPGD